MENEDVIDGVTNLSDRDFEIEILKNQGPAIITMYDKQCPHSQSVLKLLPYLVHKYERVRFFKSKIRDGSILLNPIIHDKLKIERYPTIVGMRGMNFVGQIIPEKAQPEQEKDIEELIGKML